MKNITLVEQMELGFEKQPGIRGQAARRTVSQQANWWFGQMRNVVDKAMDFKPRPAAPAHQPLLALDRPVQW